MNIVDIHLKEFPFIVITDSHTNLSNIRKVQEKFPHNQILCLGDFTSLWSKAEDFNEYSIKFFRENKIPVLKGNHEEHIVACQRGGSQYIFRAIPSFGEYSISDESLNFIKNLPIGFRIHLPNGKNYLCFHNRPKDLWSYTNRYLPEHDFHKIYPTDENTLGVVIGHQHDEFLVNYKKSKLYCVNQLSKLGCYAIIDENGLHFSKI